MELKRTPQPQFDPTVKKVQERLNYIAGSWPRLVVDGKFGPVTERAVIAYQQSRGITPASGIVGDTTYNKLMGERYTIITTAKPNALIKAEPSPVGTDTIKLTYDIASRGADSLYTVYGIADDSENSVALIFKEWGAALNRQYEGLLRRLNKIPANKSMRVRNVMKHIEKCEKYLNEARRYGITTASRVFSSNLTKEEGIKYIKDVCKIISESSITKGLKFVTKSLDAVKRFLQPIIKVLNKIPGLKYWTVIEKIASGTKALFLFDFDKAFVAFVDGLRLLLEQLLIDFVVGTAIAVGGWVALVIALVIILVVLLIDYFLFNDDPDNSWLPTTHLTTQLKPAVNEAIIRYGEREMQKGVWGGSKI